MKKSKKQSQVIIQSVIYGWKLWCSSFFLLSLISTYMSLKNLEMNRISFQCIFLLNIMQKNQNIPSSKIPDFLININMKLLYTTTTPAPGYFIRKMPYAALVKISDILIILSESKKRSWSGYLCLVTFFWARYLLDRNNRFETSPSELHFLSKYFM